MLPVVGANVACGLAKVKVRVKVRVSVRIRVTCSVGECMRRVSQS